MFSLLLYIVLLAHQDGKSQAATINPLFGIIRVTIGVSPQVQGLVYDAGSKGDRATFTVTALPLNLGLE